jgi:hypothetical protein
LSLNSGSQEPGLSKFLPVVMLYKNGLLTSIVLDSLRNGRREEGRRLRGGHGEELSFHSDLPSSRCSVLTNVPCQSRK